MASLLEESPIGRSFSILPLKVPRLKSSPGLTRWNKVQFPAEMLRAFRIWPHLNNTGGFFAVALRRNGNATKFVIEQEDSAHDIHVSSLILEELDRFWIPYECLNAYRVHRFSTKYDFMESVSVVPPPQDMCVSRGIRGIDCSRRPSRLSTTDALLTGSTCKVKSLRTSRFRNRCLPNANEALCRHRRDRSHG